MQVVATICKLIPLVVLIIFGFLWGEGGHGILSPLVGDGKSVGGVFGSVLLAVLFAFEGWTNVGTIAGEMKDPARDMPRAIVGGVSIIMAVYLLINIAYLQVIPADELMMLESPAAPSSPSSTATACPPTPSSSSAFSPASTPSRASSTCSPTSASSRAGCSTRSPSHA